MDAKTWTLRPVVLLVHSICSRLLHHVSPIHSTACICMSKCDILLAETHIQLKGERQQQHRIFGPADSSRTHKVDKTSFTWKV